MATLSPAQLAEFRALFGDIVKACDSHPLWRAAVMDAYLDAPDSALYDFVSHEVLVAAAKTAARCLHIVGADYDRVEAWASKSWDREDFKACVESATTKVKH